MSLDWELKKLSELFDVKSSKRVHKSDWKEEGIPFYRAREVVKLASNGMVEDDLFISEELYEEFTRIKGAPKEGDIIISAVGTLGMCYLVKKTDKFYFKDASVLWFENISDVNTKYIEYSFKSDLVINQVMEKSMGATVGTLTISRAKNIKINIPNISTQQQIVKILDKSFEAIEKAKTNIEKNLQNTKELFASKLNEISSQKGEGWEERTINDICEKIFAGGDKPKDDYSKEKTDKYNIPIFANAVKDKGLNGFTNFARVNEPSITISARGSGTGHTELRSVAFFPIVRLIVLIPNENIVNLIFLKYSIDNLNILRSGSAIPQLTVPMIKEYLLNLPSLEEQNIIVEKLDNLKYQTKQLEQKYQQKLNNLEELKKSILQKAFSGELLK